MLDIIIDIAPFSNSQNFAITLFALMLCSMFVYTESEGIKKTKIIVRNKWYQKIGMVCSYDKGFTKHAQAS